MEVEYVTTKDPTQVALASIILHRASGYNLDDPIVPADLRSFIAKLKQERMTRLRRVLHEEENDNDENDFVRAITFCF